MKCFRKITDYSDIPSGWHIVSKDELNHCAVIAPDWYIGYSQARERFDNIVEKLIDEKKIEEGYYMDIDEKTYNYLVDHAPYRSFIYDLNTVRDYHKIACNIVALEFSSPEEEQAYKKMHDIQPKTKVKRNFNDLPKNIQKELTDRLNQQIHHSYHDTIDMDDLAESYHQMEDVRKKYEGTDKWMTAPNGKRTNLSERQWLQVRTPNFKNWFGDWEKYAGMEGGVWNDGNRSVSKVVDENGEPREVYHGTQNGGFITFDPDKSDNRQRPSSCFFSGSRDTAKSYAGRGSDIDLDQYDREADEYEEQNGIYPVFLNIRDPHESHFDGANWDGSRKGQYVVMNMDGEEQSDSNGNMYFSNEDDAYEYSQQLSDETGEDYEVSEAQDHFESTNSVAKEAKQYGNDGAIIWDVVDSGSHWDQYDQDNVYVIFDANQVKSSVGNFGTFSIKENEIQAEIK